MRRIFLQFAAFSLCIALIYHSSTFNHETGRTVLSDDDDDEGYDWNAINVHKRGHMIRIGVIDEQEHQAGLNLKKLSELTHTIEKHKDNNDPKVSGVTTERIEFIVEKIADLKKQEKQIWEARAETRMQWTEDIEKEYRKISEYELVAQYLSQPQHRATASVASTESTSPPQHAASTQAYASAIDRLKKLITIKQQLQLEQHTNSSEVRQEIKEIDRLENEWIILSEPKKPNWIESVNATYQRVVHLAERLESQHNLRPPS